MSAYSNQRVFRFKEGDVMADRIPFVWVPSQKDKTHVVVEGERLDTLAFKYYGNSTLWYVIADVNEIFNPFETLEPGEELLIPGLS